MTYLLLLLAVQTWSSQEACKETSELRMAPAPSTCFSQTHSFSSLLTLIPQPVPQLFLFNVHLPGPPLLFCTPMHVPPPCQAAWHLLCVGSLHTGVHPYTEPEVTSSPCFGASGPLAFQERVLCLRYPLPILMKLGIPPILFHSPI